MALVLQSYSRRVGEACLGVGMWGGGGGELGEVFDPPGADLWGCQYRIKDRALAHLGRLQRVRHLWRGRTCLWHVRAGLWRLEQVFPAPRTALWPIRTGLLPIRTSL